MKRAITQIFTLLLLITLAVPAFAGKVLAEIEYFYSDDGTLIGKAFNGKRVNFEYDLRGQLLAVKDASGNDLERYTYDPAGNRLSKTINGVTTTYSYDEANQLIRSTVNGEITHYEYDAAGRMIQAGDKSYIYNGNNKVIEVRQNGKTIAKFEYNIDGQIAKAIYGDKKEEFIWDGLALIWRSGVTYINEPYVTGGNPVMAGDDVLFNDMLGSTLAVNDKAVEMTSFGETDNENAFFTGKPMIDELGYSFLFRDYNPNHGKWTTVDPLGYPDGWNQLAYCGNNTQCGVDVLGGWVEEVHHDINATYLNRQGISEHAYNWGSLSLDILNGLNAGSDWTDDFWSGNQADEKAYYHAMRSSKQTTAEAEKAYANYMSQLVTNAKYLSDCARWAYAYYRFDDAAKYENLAIIELGKLLHTFDDSFSPSHAGFQHFSWAPSAAWSHMQKEVMDVYETGGYEDTVYHSRGFRDYIYNEIVKTYNSTIWYVLRQPE